jgi:hypothetical protein
MLSQSKDDIPITIEQTQYVTTDSPYTESPRKEIPYRCSVNAERLKLQIMIG